MTRIIGIATALSALTLALAGNANAQPFAFSAREDSRFGGSSGTLVIDSEGIAFRSEKVTDAGEWPFAAIRVLRIEARDRLTIETYEGRSWVALGTGHRLVKYRIAGEGLPSEALEFLLGRVARPMVTQILPPQSERPDWLLAVRHERRGTDAAGTLELYADGLAFRGETPEHTRFWRFRDLASVLPLDPFRIEITAREADDLKPFTFQLADELPAGFRDAVWTAINSPLPALAECCAPKVAGVVR